VVAERHRGGCRHDVVFERIEVEQRCADSAQAHAAAAKGELIPHQAIFLVEPAHELCECRGTLRRAVEDPLLHAHEVLDRTFIGVTREQAHVLLLREPQRHEREEQAIQQLTRHVTATLEKRGVDAAHPLG